MYDLEQNILFIIGALFGILNLFSRFVLGFLMDKFCFRSIMFFISVSELIISTSICSAANKTFLFVFLNILTSLCLGGTLTVIGPFFDQTFGAEQGLKVYGISGIFFGIACLAGSLLTKNFVDESDDYFLLFIIGAVFVLIQLVELCFLEEAKFLYKADLQYNKIICDSKAPKKKASDGSIGYGKEKEGRKEGKEERTEK